MRASQTAKPPIDQAEAATALSVTGRILRRGGLVTPRSDRVACGRTKEPPPIREAAIASLRARSGRSRHRLIQRTRVRSVKLRAGEEFFCTIVVKPPLARLEARDYRVTRSGVMFRCMLNLVNYHGGRCDRIRPSLSDFIGSSLTSVCFSCSSSTGGPKGRYWITLI